MSRLQEQENLAEQKSWEHLRGDDFRLPSLFSKIYSPVFSLAFWYVNPHVNSQLEKSPQPYRFFRYSVGDIPVCFLNSRLKYSGLSYPTIRAISFTA